MGARRGSGAVGRALLRVVLGGALLAAPAPAQLGSAEDAEALQRGLAALLGGQLGAAPAAEEPAPAPAGAAAAPASGEFTLTPPARLEFHARHLPVADAMAQLRQLVRRNIVVAPGVTATFTGDLYDLDTEQVITAICRATNLVARYDGAFIYIEPDQPETRIFHLDHVPALDMVALIRPLLSNTGTVTATAAARQGIESSPDDAGGNEYASADTIVVRDFSSVLEEVSAVVSAVDAHPRQVLVEATILSAELRDGFVLGVEFAALLGVSFEDVGATSTTGQKITFAEDGFTSGDLDDGAGNASTSFFSGLPAGGLTVGYLRDGIGAFVKALESVTDTTVLANPKIITLNKQRGEVLLGRRDGFLTTTVTQTSTTQSVEFLETGTRLVFRPFITADDWVRLEIHPEDSDGGVNADGLPFKETAEITTNVMIPSGETVVIGGLFRERARKSVRKVPVLGDIPLLGALFRTQDDETVREEIVILLTPHVLDGRGDAVARVSRDGRERLAAHELAPQPWSDGGAEPGGVPAAGGGARWTPDRFAVLTEGYLQAVREHLRAGRPEAAAALLDSLTFADPQAPGVAALRDEVWDGLVPPGSARAADRRILDLVLRDADVGGR